MKWISHKLTSFSIYYTLSEDPIRSLIASTSSILPDTIELGPGKLIFRKHRGVSHNPLLWIFALPILFGLFKKHYPILQLPFIPTPEAFFLAIASGIALHLITDALSGSDIPLIGNKRISLKLYKTFTLSEFIIVSIILAFCAAGLVLRRSFL